MTKRIVSALLLTCIYLHSFAQQQDTTISRVDTLSSINNPFVSFILQVKDSKKVVIQWSLQPGLSPDYFNIEKNIDGRNFETIAVIKSNNSSNVYQFTDEMPTRGTSAYRVKFASTSGHTFFSDTASVNIPGSSLVNFYPNPMDNVLIVRSAFAADLLITDALGKSRVSRSIGVGPSVIDVSTLEKGVYLLRISDKSTGQQQVEKIVKN